MIELTIRFDASTFTPATGLVYRAEGINVSAVHVITAGRQRHAAAEATIIELAYTYPQKGASSAELLLEQNRWLDVDGDGVVDFLNGNAIEGRVESLWSILVEHLGFPVKDVVRNLRTPVLYDIEPDLTCEDLRQRVFRASCGSTAADVQILRGHNVLWAAVPPGGSPNQVHRHLGGNVYCLFFRGRGRFHRVHPQHGFQTLPIEVSDSNSFQFVSIPLHLWYQPINTGDCPLQYFMIHEPTFDPSELLELERNECPPNWHFEY